MFAMHALKAQSLRGNAFRASRQVSENSEFFKKLEPIAQFERISAGNQPSPSTRGSEAEPTTNSRYSSFRSRESSLARKFTEGLTALTGELYLQRPTTTLDFKIGPQARKNDSHLLSPHRVPRQGSAEESQSFSEPVGLQIQYLQTPISKTLVANLSAGHRASTFPK